VTSLSDKDWENVYKVAFEEGVVPFLYYCLNKSVSNLNIPQQVKNKFVTSTQHVLARNTVLYHELGKVLKLFSENNIRVIVLKGAYLAEKVYPHIGLRTMGDLDLLVPKGDLVKVQKLLLGRGYQQSEQLSINDQCEKSHHLIPFLNENAIMIEIHWTLSRHILDQDKAFINGLWERSKPCEIAGENVSILSPEDIILYLCIHNSFHHFFVLWLKAFCDFVETVKHYHDKIEWKKILLYAKSWNMIRCVYITLYFVSDLMEVSIPDRVLSRLKQNGFDEEVISIAKERMFADCYETPSPDKTLAKVLVYKGSGIKSIAYILKIVFIPKIILARRYKLAQGSRVVYLYYLVRIKDIIFKHLSSVLHFLRRDTEMMASYKKQNREKKLKDWIRSR
jgi:hypothetical protein